MSELFGNPNAVAREIGAQFRQGTDTIVSPPKFGAVCKVLWPSKTAAELAAAARTNERTAARWLSGEHEPPIRVLLVVIAKMFERE